MGGLASTRAHALLIIAPIAGHYIPYSVDISGVALTSRRFFVLILLGFTVYILISKSQIHISTTDIGIFFVLITLIGSVAWSMDPEFSLRRVDHIGLMLLYYAAVIVYFNRDDSFRHLLWGLLLTSVVVVLYGCIVALTEDSFRDFAIHISRNDFSRDVVALFPIVVTAAYLSKSDRRIVFGSVAAAMAILVPLSSSRSGLVSLILGVFLLSTVYFRVEWGLSPGRIIPTVTVPFVFTVLSIGAAIWLGLIPDRLASIPLTPGAFSPEVLGEGRYQVHRAELATIRRNWLTGIGYGSFGIITEMVYDIGSRRSHNLITRVWLAAGIGPVLVLLLTGVVIFRNYVRAITHTRGASQLYLVACFIGLAAITLAGMTNIVIDEPVWYLLLGVGSNLVVRDSNFNQTGFSLKT